MKRAVSLLLSALLLAPCLFSCSETTENASEDAAAAPDSAAPSAAVEEAPAEEEEPEITDDLPDADYEGFSYNIYTRSNTTHYLFLAEEMNGEALNDAIFERNSKIADRFNIVFTETEYSSEGDAATNVRAGDDTYSLMNVRCTAANNMMQKNECRDMSAMPYINLEKPYWDAELNDAISINHHNYTVIGATNLTCIDFMTCLMFNKTIHENYQLDNPYELVREGRWTFDAFGSMGAAVTSDIDGNGTLDAKDQYGMLGCSKLFQCSLIQAGDTLLMGRDEAGFPKFDLESDEHFLNVFNKIFEITLDNGAWYKTTDSTNEQDAHREMFRNNQALFLSQLFYYVESMRDMEADFGILPYPKYDEAQEDYHNRVSFFDTAVIPSTVGDVERASMILEALTCESFKTVVPTYKETALKSKYARDADSSDMIDILLNNRVLDLGDTYFVDNIRDTFVYQMFYNDDRNLSSKVATNGKATNKLLDKMRNAYAELEAGT